VPLEAVGRRVAHADDPVEVRGDESGGAAAVEVQGVLRAGLIMWRTVSRLRTDLLDA
jgi:hypothetical protein